MYAMLMVYMKLGRAQAKLAHTAGAYNGFPSMKRLGVLLLPWMGC